MCALLALSVCWVFIVFCVLICSGVRVLLHNQSKRGQQGFLKVTVDTAVLIPVSLGSSKTSSSLCLEASDLFSSLCTHVYSISETNAFQSAFFLEIKLCEFSLLRYSVWTCLLLLRAGWKCCSPFLFTDFSVWGNKILSLLFLYIPLNPANISGLRVLKARIRYSH